VPITTKVVSLNPVHGEVETCDRLVVFSGYSVSSTNKTDHQDITELLLKVALNTITPTPIPTFGVLDHEFISSF